MRVLPPSTGLLGSGHDHSLLGSPFAPLGVFSSGRPSQRTKALTMTGDMSENMVAGISLFLDRETAMAQRIRGRYWNRDFSSAENYDKSIAPNRAKFRKIVGVVDERLPLESLQYVATTSSSGVAAESDQFKIYAVRWPVMEGVYAEGLLVQPRGRIRAHIIAIPDADQTPNSLSVLLRASRSKTSMPAGWRRPECRSSFPP